MAVHGYVCSKPAKVDEFPIRDLDIHVVAFLHPMFLCVLPQIMFALPDYVLEHPLDAAYDGGVLLLLGDAIEGAVSQFHYRVRTVDFPFLSMLVGGIHHIHYVKFNPCPIVVRYVKLAYAVLLNL